MKKPIYIIVEAFIEAEGGEIQYTIVGAYLNETTAQECCDVLNEKVQSDAEFGEHLYKLGYYNRPDTGVYTYDEFFVDEVDIYDWDANKSIKKSKEETTNEDAITNEDTISAIQDYDIGENLESYSNFDEFYNKMFKKSTEEIADDKGKEDAGSNTDQESQGD